MDITVCCKLWEIVKDKEACRAAVLGSKTAQQLNNSITLTRMVCPVD